MKKYVTLEVETDDYVLNINERIERSLGGDNLKILRIGDRDEATAQQAQNMKEFWKKQGIVLVTLGDPDPDYGNKFADVLAQLEHRMFAKVVQAIEDYWERQAYGTSVNENIQAFFTQVGEIWRSPEWRELDAFTRHLGRHLNAGPGVD